MKIIKSEIAKHILLITVIIAILAICMIYPFLRGKYDFLAIPLSLMVQMLGIVGLPLTVIGLLWLMVPRYRITFGITAIIAGVFVALIISLIAALSVGHSFGILAIAFFTYMLFRLGVKVKQLKGPRTVTLQVAPFYFIILPVFVLILQLVLAKPLTQQSRNRAIANAKAFIENIDNYYAVKGHYPVSIQAQHKDYESNVVGVEKYHYSPHNNSYDLSFEQPRFLLDIFGTREWVVYNPRDEQQSYSHTAWRLSSLPGVEQAQGWYSSGNTGHPHWKYFLFD